MTSSLNEANFVFLIKYFKWKRRKRSMGFLTEKDRDVVRDALGRDILRRFSSEKIKGIAKNGGVYFACGDGDVDIRRFHEGLSERPHGIQLFGGPLYLAKSFKDYQSYFAEKLVQNIKDGMEAKETQTLFCYFHYPCGMAGKFGHGIEDVFRMSLEALDVFYRDTYFDHRKLHFFFHTKRINKGGKEEQNTYKYL